MTDSAAESNATCDHLVIQVRDDEDELLASQMETKLRQELGQPVYTCIFRVPKKLVRDNENAYVPQVVSIGPYHHGGKRFEAMEQIKLGFLQSLLHRKPTPDTRLDKFVKEIRSIEKFLRNCYDEKFDGLSSDKFVEMMVVDGCFILELCRKDEAGDSVFSLPRMLLTVSRDLLLLENQLPWVVLELLFKLTARSGEKPLNKLTWSLYFDIWYNRIETWEIRHLLDNVRSIHVGSSWRQRRTSLFCTPIPSVTHLVEIGVQFQVPSDVKDPLDITFNMEKGVMEIPTMLVQLNTESLMRNLIAYEQCSLMEQQCPMLSCAILLNHLVKSTKDLDFLIEKQIIITELGKEDTVSLCNRLSKNTERLWYYYSALADDVNEYYRRRWLRRWLAKIKRDYLFNPSSIWSTANAVIILLILTVVQTVLLTYAKIIKQ